MQTGLYTLSETVSEGGMARFSVQFSEAGEVKFPDQVEDDLANAETNATAVIDNSKSTFETIFSVAAQPAFVVQGAADKATAIADAMDTAVKNVTEPIANLTFAIRNFKASVNDLITKPGELADRIQEMFATLLDELNGDPETASRVLGNFRTFGDDFEPVIGTTPSRNKERINQDAITNLTKDLGLANDTKAVIDIDFISVEAALQKRNSVVNGLDTQLLLAIDDELFQSIRDLQTSLTRALPRIGLTEILEFTPPKTLPALVIVHALFEDLEKEDELIDENAIEHPGFVPGGDLIKISAGGAV